MIKPLEYWIALAGMVLYVAARNAEKEPMFKRIVKTVAAALLTVGLTPSLAQLFQVSEVIIAVGTMAFGMIVLDMATALLSDRAFIKQIVSDRLGGKRSGDE